MQEVLSVSQANDLARTVLEEYSIWIHGEVSNASADKYYYKYFSLKDEEASIACVIPSASLASLSFKIEDGVSLKAFGTLSVFKRDGKFQFKVAKVEKDGIGDLQAKIEAIKMRLQQEGLLDISRKRQIPPVPRRIAVITSKDGAAWKDFLKIVTERYPNMEILLYDVLVQGDKSAASVVKALTYINTLHDIDLIVITRGGGSLEDLMAFNDEALAREVANSKFPVVSAIGHEKDVSILDLVADLRASTPSNAAELITPDKDMLFQGLDMVMAKMSKWFETQVKMHNLNLEGIMHKSEISDHKKFLKRYADQLETCYERIHRHQDMYQQYGFVLHELEFKLFSYATTYITNNVTKIDQLKILLEQEKDSLFSHLKQELSELSLKLSMHDPLQILEKGYTIVTNKDGKVLKRVEDAHIGEAIQTRFVNGSVNSTILDITHHETG